MPGQFKNAEETRLEEEIRSDTTAQERMERLAEKAAEKSSKTEQLYDEDHDIFSK